MFRLIILVLIISPLLTGCHFLPLTPNSVKIDKPVEFVSDANKLIEKFRNMPPEEKKRLLTKSGHILLEEEEIPESLKLKGLRYASVCNDHVNVVLLAHPDGVIGVRVWSIDSQRPHKDKPTKYSNIY